MTFKFPPVFIAFKNCAEIYKSAGKSTDGIYTIKPDNMTAFEVFCDQTTAGGGWTVFQRRLDGSVDFYRNWSDYKHGFGDVYGEFWLGLDKIHRLTSDNNSMLRVDLEDFKGNTTYAEYNVFGVMSEKDKYRLILGFYSGKTGERGSVIISVSVTCLELAALDEEKDKIIQSNPNAIGESAYYTLINVEAFANRL